MTGEDAAAAPTPRWRQLLHAVPGKIWALIVVPVVPLVVTGLVTDWFEGDPQSASGGAARLAEARIESAVYMQDSALAAAPIAEAVLKRPALEAVLGCGGAVFAVTASVTGTTKAVLLRWTLIESEVGTSWTPPAIYESNLRIVSLTPGHQTVNVWVPYPNETAIWKVAFQAFRDRAHIPNRAMGNSVVSRDKLPTFANDIPAKGLQCSP